MSDKDAITEDMLSWIPPRRREPARPYLTGTAAQVESVRNFADEAFVEVEPGTATGIWLDLLLKGLGLARGSGESDSNFRLRALRPGIAVSKPHIIEALNSLMFVEGLAGVEIVEWFEDNVFMDDPAQPSGFFLDFDQLPLINGFVVHLDENASAETCAEAGAIADSTRAAGTQFRIALSVVGPPLASLTNDGLVALTDDGTDSLIAG